MSRQSGGGFLTTLKCLEDEWIHWDGSSQRPGDVWWHLSPERTDAEVFGCLGFKEAVN